MTRSSTAARSHPKAGPRSTRACLQNTVEQLVLALALWPITGTVLAVDGPGVVVCLGVGFAIARVAFWIGYHLSPPLRAFGFAATFYPTLMAVGWAVLWWVI